MIENPKTLMHERVWFDNGGGDAYVLLHEGESKLYCGIGGSIGAISQITTLNLTLPQAEAFIALLQKGVDTIKADIARRASTQETLPLAAPARDSACPNCEGGGCNDCLPEPHDAESEDAPSF